MKLYRTDDGWEIRDGNDVVAELNSWPPKDPEVLDILFDEASISTPQKDLFKILFGTVEPEDEREQS